MKVSLAGAALTLVLIAGPAVASPATPSWPAPACSAPAATAAPLSFAFADSPPEQEVLCGEGLCWDVSDCWNACPIAYTAQCISNGCQYTYGPSNPGGGPGGPGGPNGPTCPENVCWESSECICGSLQGTCVSNFCQY